jgi:hypothetical protein
MSFGKVRTYPVGFVWFSLFCRPPYSTKASREDLNARGGRTSRTGGHAEVGHPTAFLSGMDPNNRSEPLK